MAAQVPGAAVGVGVEGVAAVDDDVALFEVRDDLSDGLVDDIAGFDHDHDAARGLERGAELLDGVGADDLGALGLVGQKLVDLGGGAVEDGDFIAVVVHVQHQVLSHDCKADEADVARCLFH